MRGESHLPFGGTCCVREFAPAGACRDIPSYPAQVSIAGRVRGWWGSAGGHCQYRTLHLLLHVLPTVRSRDGPGQWKSIQKWSDSSSFPLATMMLTQRGRSARAEPEKAAAEGAQTRMSRLYGFSWACSRPCWITLCSSFPLPQSFLFTSTPILACLA